MLADFQISFTFGFRKKFVFKRLSCFPPHLNYVAAFGKVINEKCRFLLTVYNFKCDGKPSLTHLCMCLIQVGLVRQLHYVLKCSASTSSSMILIYLMEQKSRLVIILSVVHISSFYWTRSLHHRMSCKPDWVWSVMFCSLVVLDPRVGQTMDLLSPFISVLCHSDWLFHGSPVHVLMLSIQAVCGLPRLHAPNIVPCIISFSRQLPCFLMVWP